MKSIALHAPRDAHVPLDLVQRLLASVGSERFVDELFLTVRGIAPVSRCGLFVFDATAAPKRILSTNHGEAKVAPIETELYLKRYFRFDRVREVMRSAPSCASATAHLIQADEIEQRDYRDSYRGVALSERMSLLDRDPAGRWIAMNLYRSERHGGFASDEVERLCGLAPLFGEFARRHVELTRPPEGHSLEECRQRLLELDPALSGRELAVCSLILKGLTAKEIASDLGVAPSTVVCYRKRAYAQLGVANHKDLLSRCF